jgi:hypothetical protein
MLCLDDIPCCPNLIVGLESIKEQYALDPDFRDVLLNCNEGCTWNKFVVNDGFVFRANRLCIPVGFVHLLLMQERMEED